MLNKIQIIGRLGKDPEVKNTEAGTVANFSVAVSESYKDKNGEKKENTEWFNVVLWKNLADIAGKYVHKGDIVYIEGKMKTRTWEKDGEKKYATDLVGHELKMLGSKNGSGSTSSSSSSSDSASQTTGVSTDDGDGLPF